MRKINIIPPKLIAISLLSLLLGGCLKDPKAVLAGVGQNSTEEPTVESGEGTSSAEIPIQINEPAIERDMEKYEEMSEVVTRGSSYQSIMIMDSKDVTEEFLDDWYKNYVGAGRCDSYVILFSDQKGKGVFATGSMINVGSVLYQEDDGMVREISTENAQTYIASDTEDLMTLEESVEKQNSEAEEEDGCEVSEEHCS